MTREEFIWIIEATPGTSRTSFQERCATIYVRDNGIDPKSAERHVKRWFKQKEQDETFNPGPDWRAAIREALGDDPFYAPSPQTLHRHLQQVEERQAMLRGWIERVAAKALDEPELLAEIRATQFAPMGRSG